MVLCIMIPKILFQKKFLENKMWNGVFYNVNVFKRSDVKRYPDLDFIRIF